MILSRYEFHILLKHHNLNGIGAEIGVGGGDFSKYLLESTGLKKIYSIDPWSLSKSKYRSKWTQKKLDELSKIATQSLKTHGKKSEIIKKTSAESSILFSNKFFDFVYIDALHDYESVIEDIKLWWPKIKAGGILAGHDYTKRVKEEEKDVEFGVIEAVNKAVKELNVKLNITSGDRFPSWYFRKSLIMY